MTNQEKLAIFSSLFRGRTDVYPRRWEKSGASGWSPAYHFDWNEFNAHRAKGGTMKNFEHKTLAPVTKEVLLSHLLGKETIGVYPMPSDNTSYFIAADFDEGDWKNDCKKFIATCKDCGIEAYPEISRSGNGAHAWIFFENAYPCWKSRAAILEIVRNIFNYSEFAKEVSFDRLFPNQDSLTDGGFGNLIALPLQGKRVKSGASVFCDPNTFLPLLSQWDFLKTLHRHPADELDYAYNFFFEKKNIQKSPNNNYIRIVLDGSLRIEKSALPAAVSTFIRDKLNIFNKEYASKKRLGKSVFGTEKYFNLIQERGGEIALPRGFLQELESFLQSKNILYEIVEEYKKFETARFASVISLRSDQNDLLKKIREHTNGIVVSPPGSGKTIVTLELIAQLGIPALVLVNRTQLLAQWVERIQQFLGIPKTSIGVLSGTKKKNRFFWHHHY